MDANREQLELCAQEPIHAPSALQGHAALLATDDAGRVVAVSANLADWLGPLTPRVGEPAASLKFLLADSAYPQEPSISRGVVHDRPATLLRHRNAQGLDIIELHEPAADAEAAAAALAAGADEVIASLDEAATAPAFFGRLVRLLRGVTGFERVIAYRFDADESGTVIAESRGPRLESLMSLRFPGSDVPRQARALYISHRVRSVPDAAYVPVRLQHAPSWAGGPLDLSRVSARSVSPVHREYLRNLGVAASASVSIVVRDRLWGMLLMHHHEPRKLAVELSPALEWLARAAAMHVVHHEHRLIADARVRAMRAASVEQQIIVELERSESLADSLAAARGSILELLDADGVALMLDGKVWRHGEAPPDAECVRLLRRAIPEGEHGPVAEEAATGVTAADSSTTLPGILAIRFDEGRGSGVIWFRREMPQTVTWAGDPAKPVEVHINGSTRIAPRKSFEAWCEVVRGRSRSWQRWEVLAAKELLDALSERILRLSRLHQEIKRRQIIEANLRRVNEDITAFASLASHDLKEPVRGMTMLLELLRRSAEDKLSATERGYIERALATGGKMRSIIAGILDLARTSQGVLTLQSVRLNAIVDECFAHRRDDVAALKGSLRRDDLPTLMADATQLAAILDNLVGNAIKFHKPGVGPSVTVSAERDHSDGGWLIRVADEGIGIPADRLPLAFQPFRCCNVAPRAEGTGLGLAMCKRIAQRHGGDAFIESTPGVGTVVSIFWPDRPTAAPAADAEIVSLPVAGPV